MGTWLCFLTDQSFGSEFVGDEHIDRSWGEGAIGREDQCRIADAREREDRNDLQQSVVTMDTDAKLRREVRLRQLIGRSIDASRNVRLRGFP